MKQPLLMELLEDFQECYYSELIFSNKFIEDTYFSHVMFSCMQ